jgi:hypothetical protein
MTGGGRTRGAGRSAHPLLEQVADVATDEWWKNYLLDCSRRQLPKGVTLNGTIISYSYMGATSHYELSPAPEQAYRELCSFFALHLKVAPTREEGTRREETSSSSAAAAEEAGRAAAGSQGRKSTVRRVIDGWQGVKSKNKRTALLSRFIEMYQIDHNLDAAQCRTLSKVLYMAELRDVLDASVRMEDGLIASISCVEFDGKTFSLSARPAPTPADLARRIVRVPPPPSSRYRGYPPKQLDPDAFIELHMKALRKHGANTVVRRASDIVTSSHDSLLTPPLEQTQVEDTQGEAELG